MLPKIHVVGGGTFTHVRPHFALCAPAFGTLARQIAEHMKWDSERGDWCSDVDVLLHLTRMATAGGNTMPLANDPYGLGPLETNEDLTRLADAIIADPASHIVFWTCAVTDWDPHRLSQDVMLAPDNRIAGDHDASVAFGKGEGRLSTRHPDGEPKDIKLWLRPSEKILAKFRSKVAENPRKDIFLVACKTTAGESEEEMFRRGLRLLKTNSCNLVLVNDVQTRLNLIVTPEQAPYTPETGSAAMRSEVVSLLCDMAQSRAQGTFTRTRVLSGYEVPLDDPAVPGPFRQVVRWCIDNGAYRPNPNGVTVGHYAYRVTDNMLWSSRRHRNFNEDARLVPVEFTEDGVTAFGSKPSAGARSQMILFEDHSQYDCVVHFHCPLKPGVDFGHPDEAHIPLRFQRDFECGSHECGHNTSAGIRDREGIGVVMLDKHGPNILFRSTDDPERVIRFIERTFDLGRTTGDIE